jgi:hypothetical protein
MSHTNDEEEGETRDAEMREMRDMETDMRGMRGKRDGKMANSHHTPHPPWTMDHPLLQRCRINKTLGKESVCYGASLSTPL